MSMGEFSWFSKKEKVDGNEYLDNENEDLDKAEESEGPSVSKWVHQG